MGSCLPVQTSLARGRLSYGAGRLVLFTACSILVELINFRLGKDMAWDTLNYHLYAGFSAISNRFSQDYFAAGASSYLNPYVYLPFYLMVRAGLPALAISSILALFHSAILWICFELGAACAPTESPKRQFAVGVTAVALAIANPILLQQFGSCFADILTAELVLCGWLILVHALRNPTAGKMLLAGMVGGVATALKMTNAVHVIATLPLMCLLPLGFRGKLKQSMLYGVAAALSFAAVNAPWSWKLYEQFGNPLFPLLNSVFRSPYFTQQTLLHYRFIPSGLLDALIRPFSIVKPVNMIQEELRAPDLRYALVLILALAFVAQTIWRRVGDGKWRLPQLSKENRPYVALCIGLFTDWVLWLKGSGNGRYFIPGACVAAVVVSGGLYALIPGRVKLRNYALLTIFGVQGLQLCMGAEFRWNSAPWGGPWFNVEAPERLRDDRSLFLTIGMESNSFVIPFLAPSAGFINFSGGYALGPEGASGARISALIRRYAPNLRVLLPGRALYEDRDFREPHRSDVNELLARFNLQVVKDSCDSIVIHGLTPEIQPTFLYQSAPREIPSRDTTYLISCRITHASAPSAEELEEAYTADAALNHIEEACPDLFQPGRLLTEHVGNIWMRRYINTDLAAWVSHGEVKFLQSTLGAKIVNLGAETTWAAGPVPLRCSRRDGVYLAADVESPK